MTIDYLNLVNEIIRESEISLHSSGNDINQVTQHIAEKIKDHVPNSLKVLTFATLQLRDIEDYRKWSKNIFPDAEAYYFTTDNSHKIHYETHINNLKNELPKVSFKYESSTVVGALCEGLVGISMLKVKVVESIHEWSSIIDPQNAEILITENELKSNYDETYNALLQLGKNYGNVDFAVYVTMLSKLLMRWDVVVITANNINRTGVDNKSGLAGAILCFDRNYDESHVFVRNLSAFFAPILQLVANAALLESTHHHHWHNKNNIDALKKLRPFIDTIKKMEHDILKAVGGCFGDDLARFIKDLCFMNQDPSSLYTLFEVSQMTIARKMSIGNSGIFHLNFDEYKSKSDAFSNWLIKDFPEMYPHLEADEGFNQLFINRISEVTDEESFNELFHPDGNSSNSPLKKLLLFTGNKYIFQPHVETMKSALNRDFSGTCTLEPFRFSNYVELTVKDAANKGKKTDVKHYLNLAGKEDPLTANFARSQFHPQLWLKLYGGKVTIEWKNVKSEVIASVVIEDITKMPNLIWKGNEVASSFIAKYEI